MSFSFLILSFLWFKLNQQTEIWPKTLSGSLFVIITHICLFLLYGIIYFSSSFLISNSDQSDFAYIQFLNNIPLLLGFSILEAQAMYGSNGWSYFLINYRVPLTFVFLWSFYFSQVLLSVLLHLICIKLTTILFHYIDVMPLKRKFKWINPSTSFFHLSNPIQPHLFFPIPYYSFLFLRLSVT